jgi:hypothetical protein
MFFFSKKCNHEKLEDYDSGLNVKVKKCINCKKLFLVTTQTILKEITVAEIENYKKSK